LFFDYYRQHGLPIRVARIFNTYGPRMLPDDGRVVSNFMVQALQGEDITLYGDGEQTRSFCFVDDMIEGVTRLMNEPDGVPRPVNLGNPHEITIRALAETIISLSGAKSKLVKKPLPEDDPLQRCPDITCAREKLDWAPSISLEEGLKRTLDYFDQLLSSETAADS
jgi:UDP-glucuronate decarboxylase